jgi:hypothetical protein
MFRVNGVRPLDRFDPFATRPIGKSSTVRAVVYEDHFREGAPGLRPAAVAMAKAGSERLFGNGVADCSAHATALPSEYLLFETIALMLKTW